MRIALTLFLFAWAAVATVLALRAEDWAPQPTVTADRACPACSPAPSCPICPEPRPLPPAAAPAPPTCPICPVAQPSLQLDEKQRRQREGCTAGNVRDCRALYLLAESRDPVLATEAADHGCASHDATLCEWLGWRLAKGQGTPIDRPRALQVLRKACAADGDDCFYLGLAFEKELPDEALGAYRRGCEAKHALSCKSAGDLYVEGLLPRDTAAASGWYEAGCELGNKDACVGLVELGEKGELGNVTADRLLELKKRACRGTCRRARTERRLLSAALTARGASPAS